MSGLCLDVWVYFLVSGCLFCLSAIVCLSVSEDLFCLFVCLSVSPSASVCLSVRGYLFYMAVCLCLSTCLWMAVLSICRSVYICLLVGAWLFVLYVSVYVWNFYLQTQSISVYNCSFSLFQVVFVIWVAAYTSLAMTLYGAVSSSFHSLDHALLSVTGLLSRHYSFPDMDADDPGWGVFCVALVLCAWITLTGYVSSFSFSFSSFVPVSVSVTKTT